MDVTSVRNIIVGGGLSGLYAAGLLEQNGIQDYMVLEARETFGGRIISWPDAFTSEKGGVDKGIVAGRFDLGATWYWPAMQPGVHELVQQLRLETFQQYEVGEMLIERSREYAPSRVDGLVTAPPALRLAGGMSALVDALRMRLPAERLVSGRQVTHLRQYGDCIAVQTKDAQGQAARYSAARVLLAVPPQVGRQHHRIRTCLARHAAAEMAGLWNVDGASRQVCGHLRRAVLA